MLALLDEVLQQVFNVRGRLVEAVSVDLDPQHLRLVLVLADFNVTVSLAVRSLAFRDLHGARRLQRVALGRLEAALGVRGDAADLIEVIEEGEALLRANLVERADRSLGFGNRGLAVSKRSMSESR
jgi:hypothetical protein